MTDIRDITWAQLLGMFSENVHQALDDTMYRWPRALGMIVFENLDVSSSRLGERSAMPFGPDNTIKSLDDVKGKWLNDLPSQRQYPVAVWRKIP